jgi:hypothetical protein
MTRRPRRGPWAATALLLATLVLSACGAATVEPEANPATDEAAPATFGDATFDASTWR